MMLRVGSRTDIGLVRRRNEDALLVRGPLFAVADGMGGHPGGDVASAIAIDALGGAGVGTGSADDALVAAVKEANRAVLVRADEDRELAGMGTTITALAVTGESALIAHVGDSRAYLYREAELRQLTEDHTLVQHMVREGKLRPEEAKHHPQRSILTRALGVEGDLVVDELRLDLLPGDRVLLCTDGLTGMLSAEAIREALDRQPDPQSACDLLVKLAVEAGGDDNITLVLVDVEANDDIEPSADVDPNGDVAGLDKETIAEPGDALPSHPSDPESIVQRAESRVKTAIRPAEAPLRARRRFPWRRALIWTGSVVAIAAIAFAGLRIYLHSQWYVGESGGRVAVFQGIPAKPLGVRLSHVEEVTDLPAARAEQLQPWKGLAEGVNVGSRTDALTLVDQIRSDLAQTPPGARSSGGSNGSSGSG